MGDNERLRWVDVARGIGIVLVTVGHVDRGLITAGVAPHSGPLSQVDAWIYSFHMPLFFWLSGLFAVKRERASTGQVLTGLWCKIAYPYFLWSLLQTAVQVAFAGSTNHQTPFSSILRIPVDPPMQFWFLYALFLITLFHHGLMALVRSAWGCVAITGILALLLPLAPFPIWDIAEAALSYAPFFALGAVSLAPIERWRRPLWAGGLAALAFGAVTFLVSAFGRRAPSTPLGMLSALLGSAGVVGTSLVVSGYSWTKGIAVLGRASLSIFVAHTLASAGVRIVLLKLGQRDLALHVVLGVSAGLLLPLVLHLLVERYRVPFVFSWPSRSRR